MSGFIRSPSSFFPIVTHRKLASLTRRHPASPFRRGLALPTFMPALIAVVSSNAQLFLITYTLAMKESRTTAANPTKIRTPIRVEISDAVSGMQPPPVASDWARGPMSELAPPATVLKPLPVIEGYLDIFSSTLELPATLVDAIRYSFLGAGKRLRPLLAWHCAAAVGGRPPRQPARRRRG